MQKLTLSVDARVIERAKRYAKANGTSVSQLVEKMLDIASAPAPAAGWGLGLGLVTLLARRRRR